MINTVAQRALHWTACAVIAALLVILFAGYDQAASVFTFAALSAAIGFVGEELIRWVYRRTSDE